MACRLCRLPVTGARIYHKHCKPSPAFLHTVARGYLSKAKASVERRTSDFILLKANESGRARYYLHFDLDGKHYVTSRAELAFLYKEYLRD